MEEGSEDYRKNEEQFQLETLTLTQCSSAVKKVQETGKYTEEAILPICSSVVRSSKCDFFSEALSLATSHTDFNDKVFCKNIAEAHFCSQTMDKLLSSPVMSDLAFGACMRDKSNKGEQYCQRFSKMHAYAVQQDDLDTMRACYMMEAYDEEDRMESNSKKTNEPNPKKTNANTTKQQAVVAVQHAAVKVHGNAPVTTAESKQHGISAKAVSGAAKNASVKVDAHVKNNAAMVKDAALTNNTKKAETARKEVSVAPKKTKTAKKDAPVVAKKGETSLVSSLIHTLSAVAHAVVKVVSPTSHEVTGKSHNSTSAHAVQTAKAPVKGKKAPNVATHVSFASTSKGASLTQAQKVGVKQTGRSSQKHGKVAKTTTSVTHSIGSRAIAPTHHGEKGHAAKSSAPIKPHHKAVVKQHKIAVIASGKHSSSQKVQKRDEKDAKDKDEPTYFMSGFLS
jgi:hypothetical protein